MNGIIPAISKAGQSLNSANETAVQRIGTGIKILGIASDSSEAGMDTWIKNIGTYPIGPVASIDVFLITPGENYSSLMYDPAGGPGSWREYPPGATWERGEVLHMEIVIPLDFPTWERFHVLRVSTPNGVVGDEPFERW